MPALAFPKHKRVLSEAYLARVRQLRCCAWSLGECLGAVQAHHKTGAGMARKADDVDTMPLCAHHHSQFHGAAGPFRRWTKLKRVAWQALMIEATQIRLGVAEGVF